MAKVQTLARNSLCLYVVSGFMRSGTSMMMQSLEAGGLIAVKSEQREKMRHRHKDQHYDPNKGGLYELSPKQYLSFNFPREYEGKLIKALYMGVPRMAVMPNGIRVVFMTRDKEEIRQSYSAFFGKNIDMTNHRKKMNDVIQRIKNRKDVKSCDVFEYREVVKNPLKHFKLLKSNGWEINPSLCSQVVNTSQYRYKKEKLEVGVI